MAKTDNLTDFLTGVADAIRTKKGTTAKINPQNFETEIGSITTSKPEQEKTAEATNSRQTILPDYGKTLSKVTVEAAPLPDIYNSGYKNINKCLIDKQNKILILGCDDSVIPSDGSVTSIGKHAFEWCSELASITIPNSVTSIGSYAFSNCRGFTSITIPDSVTSIDYQAFYECSGLTSIIIPNSVTSITFNAFGGCSGIESLVVTTGNKKYHSANNCIIETNTKILKTGCKTSVIPSDGSVTSIGLAAFLGCSGLTSIAIPDSVTLIDLEAFRECTSLTSVIIPDSVTSIGDNAFFYCIGLTSITIGNSVTSIGGAAFQQCIGLTSVTIGNSVTSIGLLAFNRCSSLTSITIPNSVTSIGGAAFTECSSLISITMLPTNPPTLVEGAISSNVTTITVPVGCGDAYKTAEGWSAYADKIVEAAA